MEINNAWAKTVEDGVTQLRIVNLSGITKLCIFLTQIIEIISH